MPVIHDFAAFIARGGLVCPLEKTKIEFSLAEHPGLFVQCSRATTSVPTWYLRLKGPKGTNVYRRIGTVAEVSLPRARKLAQQYKAEHLLASKLPPPEATPKSSMLLRTFFADHYMPHALLRSCPNPWCKFPARTG